MRVGVVAPGFTPGRSGGVESYLRELLAGLQQVDPDNEYRVFVFEAPEELGLHQPNFSAVPLGENGITTSYRRIPILRRWWSVKRRIEATACDVLHFPYETIWPNGMRGRKLVSVHDLQHEHVPEFFAADDLAWRKRAYPASCAEAHHIAALSDFTRSDIITRYGVPEHKITTVHASYSSDRFSGPVPPPGDLPDQYFLYPAANWPHKNHARLLEAFAAFLRSRPDFHLVLTGLELDRGVDLGRAVAALGLAGHVHRLGYRPYEDLPGLYRGACALIYPSLFEGFGIPLLEAMASSCPVAASNVTALPEAAGDAALLFDPTDTHAIAVAMERLVSSDGLRAELVRRGTERVARFTDVGMATKMLEVYERLSRSAAPAAKSATRSRSSGRGARRRSS